ncbi:hypothetical protein SUGI_0956460 [Cryptomeria japonica]|nr:hypothetical protein SUGI_0956460 [Cryptomeria japonica]
MEAATKEVNRKRYSDRCIAEGDEGFTNANANDRRSDMVEDLDKKAKVFEAVDRDHEVIMIVQCINVVLRWLWRNQR